MGSRDVMLPKNADELKHIRLCSSQNALRSSAVQKTNSKFFLPIDLHRRGERDQHRYFLSNPIGSISNAGVQMFYPRHRRIKRNRHQVAQTSRCSRGRQDKIRIRSWPGRSSSQIPFVSRIAYIEGLRKRFRWMRSRGDRKRIDFVLSCRKI